MNCFFEFLLLTKIKDCLSILDLKLGAAGFYAKDAPVVLSAFTSISRAVNFCTHTCVAATISIDKQNCHFPAPLAEWEFVHLWHHVHRCRDHWRCSSLFAAFRPTRELHERDPLLNLLAQCLCANSSFLKEVVHRCGAQSEPLASH